MISDYACALLVRDGRILLGLRSPSRRLYPNCWDVLGGRVEAGETLHVALTRELGEEIGVRPTSIRSVGVIEDHAAHIEGILRYHMSVVNAWGGGEPRIANDEHVRLGWFRPDEACALEDLAVEAYRGLFLSVAAMIAPL